ncbi:MAG: YeeE/YedE family protein [Paracoccaceae bacterium]
MFQDLGFDSLGPRDAALIFGLAIGLLFGVFAQISRFCLRSALVGNNRTQAAGIWAAAFAVAILGTQVLVAAGFISFESHRFLSPSLPYAALIVGGLAFGAGMVLTRGCISRLSVLVAGGNLRAFTVLVIFAIIAHATLKGLLAPLRVWLGSFTLDLGAATSLAALPGGAWAGAGLLAIPALWLVMRSRAPLGKLLLGAGIGALIPLAWVGTGFVLYDEFDPIAHESLSFTLPYAETLFWTMASSAVSAGFGVGLVGGVLTGALAATLVRGEFKWTGFETPATTGRYALGAALMGVGGVLAGGCTIGAGLSGTATLSLAALIALASIAAGALGTNRLLAASSVGALRAQTA